MKEEEDKQFGKYGKKGHLKLIKATLLHIIEKYYETFGVIKVENTKITMGATIGDYFHTYGEGTYSLHPDIALTTNLVNGMGTENPKKIIVVECETTPYGLLKDEMRLTAYKLLRLDKRDTKKYMLYISMPIEFKGKVEKPDFFNDIWFFDIDSSQ